MKLKLSIKNIIRIIAAASLVVILAGCSKEFKSNQEGANSSTADGFNRITPEEAMGRLNNEKGIIILDVRTKEEYEAGHIKDAKLIPVDNLEKEASEVLNDKEAPIFVYCRSGNRSITAANILVNQGYKNVHDLGGIKDWPYEIVK